jgi:hypothetical protein
MILILKLWHATENSSPLACPKADVVALSERTTDPHGDRAFIRMVLPVIGSGWQAYLDADLQQRQLTSWPTDRSCFF